MHKAMRDAPRWRRDASDEARGDEERRCIEKRQKQQQIQPKPTHISLTHANTHNHDRITAESKSNMKLQRSM